RSLNVAFFPTRRSSDLINRQPVDFLLGAGDLTSQGSDEQLTRYQTELQKLEVPYYTSLGNHELGQSPTLWHDHFGRANLHVDYRSEEHTSELQSRENLV